jgi:hypothetical protein
MTRCDQVAGGGHPRCVDCAISDYLIMNLPISILLFALMGWLPLHADPVKAVTNSAEGRRAFYDLAAIYAEGPSATFQAPAELTDLANPDAVESKKAGDYVIALFEQSWADETNARASWRALPFWGGGSDNPLFADNLRTLSPSPQFLLLLLCPLHSG